MTAKPSKRSGKTSPASIAARFPAEAKRLDISVEAVRDEYAREAFFRRLAVSSWRETFILKGSVLLVALLRQCHRPTQDADFLVLRQLDADALRAALVTVASQPMDDQVVFDVTSLRMGEMQADASLVGQRVTMAAALGHSRLIFRADIGFNDVITPRPGLVTFDAILADPITIWGSTLATVIAEKFDAVIDHGLANTRAKDFYDLATIARNASIDGEDLLAALRATFHNRSRRLPTTWPPILDQVATEADQIQRYRRFLEQAGRPSGDDLPSALAVIRHLLEGPLRQLGHSEPFKAAWIPTQGWTPREP